MRCVADDGKCGRDSVARGLCGKHYQRWSKTGDPQGIKPNPGNRTPRPAVTERTCTVCGFTGPADRFPKAKNQCKPCNNTYKREWLLRNPEKYQVVLENGRRGSRNALRRRAVRAGQDPDVIEAHVRSHHGQCDICGRTPGGGERGLHIDHDHKTGQFRGLVCNNCNGGLGRFHDDPEVLAAAIRYLEAARAT